MSNTQQPAARSYTTLFFDLDGTLLPIETSAFMKAYTRSLGEFAHDHGMDGNAVMGALFEGVKAMAANDGSRSNHDVFWPVFSKLTGTNSTSITQDRSTKYPNSRLPIPRQRKPSRRLRKKATPWL